MALVISSSLGLNNVAFSILIAFSPYVWLIVAAVWSTKHDFMQDDSRFSEGPRRGRVSLPRTWALVFTLMGMVIFLPVKTWIVAPVLILYHFLYVGKIGKQIDDAGY